MLAKYLTIFEMHKPHFPNLLFFTIFIFICPFVSSFSFLRSDDGDHSFYVDAPLLLFRYT